MSDYQLTIALPKGRLGEQTMQLFKKSGYQDILKTKSRKLVFIDSVHHIRYLIVKPIDVMAYVENGVADLGIVGYDTILESQSDVYILLDLKCGQCRFAVAGNPKENLKRKDVLSVATKYPNVARRYFQNKGQSVDIITLNGSVELAPLVGLSDVIVDIVETGNTLKANGLEVLEEMMGISARLIANRASYRLKNKAIKEMVDNVKKEVDAL